MLGEQYKLLNLQFRFFGFLEAGAHCTHGPWFVSRPGVRLSLTDFFVVFFSPSKQMPGWGRIGSFRIPSINFQPFDSERRRDCASEVSTC
jgi:hypothetical protein